MKNSTFAAILFTLAATLAVSGCDKKIDNTLIGVNQCNIIQEHNADGSLGKTNTVCKKASINELIAAVSESKKNGGKGIVSVDVNGHKLM